MRTTLLILIAILTGSMLSGCIGEKTPDLEAEVNQLRKEYNALKEQRSELKKRESELEDIVSESRKQKPETADTRDSNDVPALREYEEILQSAVESVTAQADSWKQAARESLVGAKMASIELNDGRVLTDAEIRQLDANGVVLKHSAGEEMVALTAFPEAVRRQLLHEPTVIASEFEN